MSNPMKGSRKIKVSALSDRAIAITDQFAKEHGISFGLALNRLVVQAEKQRLAVNADSIGHADMAEGQVHDRHRLVG